MSKAPLRAASAVALILAQAIPAQAPAQAQAGPAISIGKFDAEQACTIYQQYAGRRAEYADPWVYASYTSFFTYLVKDCVQNFPSLRTALQAALASSGKFAQRPGGYVVTGHLSRVSGTGGPAPDAPDMGPGGFSITSSSMFVTMDFTVKDVRGRIVFGDVVTKRIEVSSDVNVNGFRATSLQGGPGLYGVLQKEMSQAIARKVAFNFVPLEVVRAEGTEIQLNYGGPLLALGQIIQATAPDGSAVARYRVTSASTGSALAELEGDGRYQHIVPGSKAIVIEADDPAANGPRFKRTPLPR